MDHPRCRLCQGLLYTMDEVSQNLCSSCAQNQNQSQQPSGRACCQHHPELEATAICRSCGAFLCQDCRVDYHEQGENTQITTYCQDCAREFEKKYYYCAWEDTSVFFYKRFWITWKEIVFNPSDFFDRLPRIPDTASPLSFAYLSSAHLLLFMMLILMFGNYLPSLPELIIGTMGLIGITTLWLFVVPVSLYLSAFFTHLGILIQFKKKKFHQTFRVIGYASALQVLYMLPIINIIASVCYLVVMVKGLKRVHQLSTGQVILAIFFIPLIFVAAIIAMAIILSPYLPKMPLPHNF